MSSSLSNRCVVFIDIVFITNIVIVVHIITPPVQVMDEVGVRRIVFSSSATVYGVPEYLPLDEKHRTGIKPLLFVLVIFLSSIFRQLHEPLRNNKVRSGEDDDGPRRLLGQVECHLTQVPQDEGNGSSWKKTLPPLSSGEGASQFSSLLITWRALTIS